ncbi:hypothetical protein JRC49_07285 [Clostridiales bacterium FE2011]|uniref:Uncharacterized protein n=1 Tax=Aristaeella hokkaidonensis TaxID=3046382 RepID=A0AC61N3S6_9FIRM|nr:hypothetical protein JRC49_07285 [Clostridiales bacterium FE2011]QTE75941.1 hypothetical protein JS518_11760 [Clostridiales bacterium FE2010]QUC68684.1 hypothetical protein JYE49_13125 [Aristaeella hokkaidonensis]
MPLLYKVWRRLSKKAQSMLCAFFE